MKQAFHFISGLPRSGSTLLSAILQQNPRFHAGMTSPVGGMYLALEGSMCRKAEGSVFINNEQRIDLLQGLFHNYYKSCANKEVIFDTNRIWCTKLPALTKLFPLAKVICCVRDIAWIMDSLERLIRSNAFETSALSGYDNSGTVYTRINRFATSDGLVGYALDALKEAFFGEQAANIILVEYEALAYAPLSTMRHIYRTLGENYFEHDFDNINYSADEFDFALGTPGLHKVRSKVEYIQRTTVLPPDLFDRFSRDMFWRESVRTNRPVAIIKPDFANGTRP